MAASLPPGPFETLTVGGMPVPSYVIPFDKNGVLQAPLTAKHLEESADAETTDIYLFSHGWNTDWNGAVDFYRRFMRAYGDVVQAHGQPHAGGKALMIGVFWPSIVLPSSEAPQMAGGADTDTTDIDVFGIQALAEEFVPVEDRPELYELAQCDSLDEPQARRFAQLLRPLYARTDTDLADPQGEQDVDGVLRLWARLNEALQEEESGPVVISGPRGPADPSDDAGGPAAAGLPAFLDPRNIVRLGTVLLMKDRAGVVGSHGVRPLLVNLLNAAPGARIHLVGHSYGCRVVLSALCAGPPPRPVRSVLLLQPALSYLAFAANVPGVGTAGGYEPAKERSELPIMVTWTRRDTPLRQLFQLAARRASDVGDQDIGSAGLETPPSRFAAMGGWGPAAGPGVSNEKIRLPADGGYVFGAGVDVLALESHTRITGHSDVVQDATAWALYNLVRT